MTGSAQDHPNRTPEEWQLVRRALDEAMTQLDAAGKWWRLPVWKRWLTRRGWRLRAIKMGRGPR